MNLSSFVCFFLFPPPLPQEHVCWPDESRRHVLREHFPPGVVPQPGAAPDALPVSQLSS